MNNIIGFGAYLLALPVAVFGIFHFMNTDTMTGMTPCIGTLMVYLTGIRLLAVAVSILIGKMDKLAPTLLGIMFLLFIIHHTQNMSNNQMKVGNILKNIVMAGGAFLYASMVKDDTYVK